MMKIPDEHDLVIQAMVDRGMTDQEIGDQYGISRESVHYFRRKRGIKSQFNQKVGARKIPRAIKLDRIPQVTKLIERGMSNAAIGVELHCSGEAVAKFCAWYGIKRKLVITQKYEKPRVEIVRPREIGQYYDETLGHMVRVIEPCYAIGDLKPENENEVRRELERAMHPGETSEASQRPNYNPGWTNG